ncbi:MAG TPA: hypothetical protein PKK48_04145, partial [Phycisphaerae bacterium]|nr:hypothetical protein [Phycisphaerae bacterium]
MTSPFIRHDKMTLPYFESLEQRMLLTTLHGGEFFIYLNSQGQAVRIDLNVGEDEDSNDAEIELLAYDEDWGGVTDLAGIYNGDPTSCVLWSDGEGNTASPIEATVDETTGKITYSWQHFTKATDTEPEERGAETEIYAIYVSKSTADTYITITTLASADIPTQYLYDWYNNINTWDSSTTPIVSL